MLFVRFVSKGAGAGLAAGHGANRPGDERRSLDAPCALNYTPERAKVCAMSDK